MADSPYHLPAQGKSKEVILAQLQARRRDDLRWQDGKVFSLVFSAGNEAEELLQEAYGLFFSENMLNPTAFPSLRRCETEVVAMTANLLGGDENVVGNMTTGGTESILMAVLTAREWARAKKPGITQPEMILPKTAHPAFDKAAHYFGVRLVHVGVDDYYRADVDAVRTAVTENTILIVGSAPAYPHGIIDPIAELAEIAKDHQILCHVDACVGGFMLPFVRRLGYRIPDFDFNVQGVTSISADLHKYGYAAKGASVILYRSNALRRYQLFASTDWPGGIYASPTMSGTRPGGVIAASWAILHYLGEEGYLETAKQVMDAARSIREGIEKTEFINILGQPEMSIMALSADKLDIYGVGDEMSARGWHMDRQHFPPSLHVTVNFAHVGKVNDFLMDLRAAVSIVSRPSARKAGNMIIVTAARWFTKILPERWLTSLMGRAATLLNVGQGGSTGRTAAMYGMIGTLPNRGDLKEVVLDLVEQFTMPTNEKS